MRRHKKIKTLITGANGMLGHSLCGVLRKNNYDVVATDVNTNGVAGERIEFLDVRDPHSALICVEKEKPGLIFHLAAETNVDRCQELPERAREINVKGTENIALICRDKGIRLVYVSTCGVFDGEKDTPYNELDEPDPVSVHHATKYEGELIVRELVRDSFILRAGWMMGGRKKDKKFVSKIISLMESERVLSVVNDKKGSPTFTRDFSECALKILDAGECGLYHVTNKGWATRHAVACKVAEYLDRDDVIIKPVSSDVFPLPAPRPRSEASESPKLKLLGIEMRPWEDALREYIGEFRSQEMSQKYVYKKKRYVVLFSIIDLIGNLFSWVPKRLKRVGEDGEIKKIAVFELAHLGDLLALTPALRLLKEKFPRASVTVCVSPWCREAIAGNPDVDEVIVYRASWFDRLSKRPFSLSETAVFLRHMRRQRFDLGIDPRGDFRNVLLMWLGNIKRRVGYGFAGGGFLLTQVKPFEVARRQDRHQADHNIDLINSIRGGRTVDHKDRGYRISFSKDDRDYADSLLKQEKISEKDLLIAIHPGGALPTKRWPLEKFASLIDAVVKRHDAKVVLVGGGEEGELAGRLKKLARKEFIDAIGKTNTHQLAALLKRCSVFVGGDSGVMHVATALKVPIVAIWGGHNKPSHWQPISGKNVIIHKEVDCGPCGLSRCDDLKCLGLITVEEVLKGVTGQVYG